MCCGVLLVYLYQQVVTYLAHHLVLSHDAHIYFNLLKPKISFLNHFHSSHPQNPLMFYLNQMIINLTLLLLKNTWQNIMIMILILYVMQNLISIVQKS